MLKKLNINVLKNKLSGEFVSDKELNCWEFKKCGREPDGDRASRFGVCPSAVEERLDGTNSGKNGGRACWGVAGTKCDGALQGTYAQKLDTCLNCDFYRMVCSEEKAAYDLANKLVST